MHSCLRVGCNMYTMDTSNLEMLLLRASTSWRLHHNGSKHLPNKPKFWSFSLSCSCLLHLKAVHRAERTAISMQQQFCKGSLGSLPLARGGRLSPSHVTRLQVVAASHQTTSEAFRRKSVIQLIAANVELNVSPPFLVICLILAVLF